MKRELLIKQSGFLSLSGEHVHECIVIDDVIFLIRLRSQKSLIISQKVPHIGYCLVNETKMWDFLPKDRRQEFTKLKNRALLGLIFDPDTRELTLYLEGYKFCFVMVKNGAHHMSPFAGGVQFPPHEVLSIEDKTEVQKYADNLLAHIFHAQVLYKRKIQRQIEKFQKRQQSLPQVIEDAEQRLIFILEHQTQIQDKDPSYRSLFEKYLIPIAQPLGIVIKKAYKNLAKVRKEQEMIENIIKMYQLRLDEGMVETQPRTIKDKQEAKSSRIFRTSSGELIKVAKSDKDADVLTFKQANGNYHWLHVQDYPGAHTVIFSQKPSEEALCKARFLAKYFSKAKQLNECYVIQTQVKFLKKGKKPGEVYISKKSVVLVKHDANLEKMLFEKLN